MITVPVIMTLNGHNTWLSDIFLEPENIEKEAYRIIRVVRKHWKEEDVKFQICPISFVNRVSKADVNNGRDALIFRVYPRGQFDSVLDKVQEKQTTLLLNELRISPKVNCVFQNGVCFDHVTGMILDWTDFSPLDDISMAKSAIRELACFHCMKTRDLAISKYRLKESNTVPGVFESLMKLYPKRLPTTDSKVLKRIPSFATLRSEVNFAFALIEDMSLPLVMCHNDPNPTNVIYNRLIDKSTIVDYDICGFGFAAYDLAYFLVSSCLGSNPASPASHRRQPSYIKDVLSEYLKTIHSLDNTGLPDAYDVTEDEVERLYHQVRKSSLVVMLFYVLLYLIDTTVPQTKLPYGSPRLFLRMAGDLYTDRYLEEREEAMCMQR